MTNEKKWLVIRIIVAILIVALIVGGAIWLALTHEERNPTTVETPALEGGSYSVFRTIEVQEYLSFLENLDEEDYEIVDISNSVNPRISDDCVYVITYKKIAK